MESFSIFYNTWNTPIFVITLIICVSILIKYQIRRRKDQDDLRKAHEKLIYEKDFSDAILDAVPGFIFLLDASGNLLRGNRHYTEMFKADGHYLSWVHDDDKDKAFGALKKTMTSGYADIETRIVTGYNALAHYYVNHIKINLHGKDCLLGIGIDISKIKLIEEQLRQSEERFSKLFRLSPEAILLIDYENSNIIDANISFSTLTGYAVNEIIGHSLLDINLYVDADAHDAIYTLLSQNGHVDDQEFEGRRKDGQTFSGAVACQVIDVDGQKLVIFMLRDITEFKKMQEMMIQTEKMISVGGIAAGIAHEINNPLGIILQATQNFVQRTAPDFPKNIQTAEKLGIAMPLIQQYMQARKLDVFIQDIQGAAVRAAGIIRHMLDFSRRSESRRKACDLVKIVDKAIVLAANDYDLNKSYDFKRIQIVRHYDEVLPEVNCSETEIEQVLLNLLRNAAQALMSMDLSVESPRIDVHIAHGADSVTIEVGDNGPGIPADKQRRVFEPFYTTKPPGVGTGLGLSVSYFIITKGHGGKMTVTSNPGVGTTFKIVLPVEDAVVQ